MNKQGFHCVALNQESYSYLLRIKEDYETKHQLKVKNVMILETALKLLLNHTTKGGKTK